MQKEKYFPLYKADVLPSVKMLQKQKDALNEFENKVNTGVYNFIENPCVCRHKKQDDIVITEKDRYGITINNLLCKHCGVIRTEKILDNKSTTLFYNELYRPLYLGEELASANFFKNQEIRGQLLYLTLNKLDILKTVKAALEIGCGAGGIMYPFAKNGINIIGCDYGTAYLDYGKKKGLKLFEGNIVDKQKDESVDMILLIHVFEHFTNPVDDIIKIINKISIGGYLVIEVPSILNIHKIYMRPILFFQNVHTFNFHQMFLNNLFLKLGLEIVYSDEISLIVLKKAEKKIINPEKIVFYTQQLAQQSIKIKKYILTCYVKYEKLKLYIPLKFAYRIYNKLIR